MDMTLPKIDWKVNYEKSCHSMIVPWVTAQKASLLDVFDEAVRLNAVIAWVPDGTVVPEWVGVLCDMMQRTWGENPPYIEVEKGQFISSFYSIKPVWEL